MEINEFLTRISLSGGDATIFSLYEKGKNLTPSGKEVFYDRRTLKTYTKTEDAIAVGLIAYDKPFPKQIFATDPQLLKNILADADDIRIEDSYLIARGNMDFKWKLEVLDKTKKVEFVYERPDMIVTKEVVSKIIRADKIIETNTVSIVSDGKEVVVTLEGKIKGNNIKIKLNSNPVAPFDALYEKGFIECLKLAGEKDLVFNVDGKREDIPSHVRGLGKIELSDPDAKITYYLTEVTRSVTQTNQTEEENTEKDNLDDGKEIEGKTSDDDFIDPEEGINDGDL